MSKKNILRVIKIGGHILDDPMRLSKFLSAFAQLPDAKILVHGGGKLATQLANELGVPQTMIDGRRVTDAETLRIAVMVYAGWINKQLVAQLSALGCPALGVCGADGDVLRAHKRVHPTIDFGWVGDIDLVNTTILDSWLGRGLIPVVAPITHDGQGQLLNTNADTIAREIAQALSKAFHVELIFGFEKSGVLMDMDDPDSSIDLLNLAKYKTLKAQSLISDGMIPKLDNAFGALEKGVRRVVVGQAELLTELLAGTVGTTIVL
jgi:acetylglutamate kinase